jgi:hypothetical protein
MKYVVYEDPIYGPTAVVGPETMQHTQLANACCSANILSAGFCHVRVRDGKIMWHVYSESLSLSKRCNPEVDSQIVNESLTRSQL